LAIKVVPYTADRIPSVAAFNKRMQAGGSKWGWYEESEDSWLPAGSDRRVWREHFVAVDDDGEVHGAYALKPQAWKIKGEDVVVSDWQGPVSEGAVSPKHNMIGMRLFRDMVKRRALLYSWGHGEDDAMLQMLKAMKWPVHGTPFLLRVVKPFRFLRLNRYLRNTNGRRLALDLLAFSGLGWLGLKFLFGILSYRRWATANRRSHVEVEEVAEFGDWADALWDRCASEYSALGCRDAQAMNELLPRGGWPEAIRLRVSIGEEDLGWVVVMDHALENDGRFGDLRVGSVIDCLASPQNAPAVIGAATRFLEARGVDLICSNQSHPAWIEAFGSSGYVNLPNRRLFAASPALHEALEPFDEISKGLHLTNLDGHGPHAL